MTGGFMWGMAGWNKVFNLTPAVHTSQFFTGPYADSWIPQPLLWIAGMSIPYLELIGGFLLVAGLFRRPVSIVLGAILVTVTYGHLIPNPMFVTNEHILPRTLMLVPTWVFGVVHDPWSLDGLLARWRGAE
jgi:uncharacterized membrane protein YphA (DoxX/SURF4 family)